MNRDIEAKVASFIFYAGAVCVGFLFLPVSTFAITFYCFHRGIVMPKLQGFVFEPQRHWKPFFAPHAEPEQVYYDFPWVLYCYTWLERFYYFVIGPVFFQIPYLVISPILVFLVVVPVYYVARNFLEEESAIERACDIFFAFIFLWPKYGVLNDLDPFDPVTWLPAA